MPKNRITAEHQQVLDRIKPYVQAEHMRLEHLKKSGAEWENNAAEQEFSNVISSNDLADTNIFHSSTMRITVSEKDDIRVAKAMESGIRNRLNEPDLLNRYNNILQDTLSQCGGYNKTISESRSDIRQAELEMHKAPPEAKPALREKVIEKIAEHDKQYFGRAKPLADGSYNTNQFPSDSMICREFAAVASKGMHYGGIEHSYMTGDMSYEGMAPARHTLLYSKPMERMLDVTPGVDGKVKFSTLKVLNTNCDLNKGDTIIALREDGQVICYGSGGAGGHASQDRTEIRDYHQMLIKNAKETYKDQIELAKTQYAATPQRDSLDYWRYKDGHMVSYNGQETVGKETHNTKAGHIEGFAIENYIFVLDKTGANFAVHNAISGERLGYTSIERLNTEKGQVQTSAGKSDTAMIEEAAGIMQSIQKNKALDAVPLNPVMVAENAAHSSGHGRTA